MLALWILVLMGAGYLLYGNPWERADTSNANAPAALPQKADAIVPGAFVTPEAAEPEPPAKPKASEQKSELEPAPVEKKLASASQGETWYQYTDERGSVRFASSLSEVPPQWRERAGRIEMSAAIKTVQTIQSPRPTAAPPSRVATAAAAISETVWDRSGPEGDVILYTTSWCGYCRKAIAHLNELGVDFEEKDIEEDAEAKAEYLQKSGGRRGVPLIDVGGQIMQGYSRARLDEMLKGG